jgi:hypothetical protein
MVLLYSCFYLLISPTENTTWKNNLYCFKVDITIIFLVCGKHHLQYSYCDLSHSLYLPCLIGHVPGLFCLDSQLKQERDITRLKTEKIVLENELLHLQVCMFSLLPLTLQPALQLR